jgi:phospholipase D1/2
MHIQFEAINRHKTSIFQLLKDLPIDVNDYIHFVGTRNHGLFGENKNTPKTEIIYIHSKLMIVDDRFMIIGSANINDRSLLGSRDSELAMVIEDPNGSVGKGSIFEFRCSIFLEHFGMGPESCADLNSYWKKLIEYSRKNT